MSSTNLEQRHRSHKIDNLQDNIQGNFQSSSQGYLQLINH